MSSPKPIAALLLVVLSSACSDERERPDASSTPRADAGVDAGSEVDSGVDADAGIDADATAQLFSGTVALFAGGNSAGPSFAVATLAGTTVSIAAEERGVGSMRVRESGDHIFLLDDGLGRVSMHQLAVGLPELRAFDLPGGEDVHPAEVEYDVVRQRLYISVRSAEGLMIADFSSATPVVRTLDLSGLAEDGNPDAEQLLLDGDYLLVGLSRRTRDTGLSSGQPARIAVIDVAQETISGMIELPHTAITGGFVKLSNGDLLVSMRGNTFQDAGGGSMEISLDGAIHRLVRSGAGDYTVGAAVLSEQALGGSISNLYMIDDARGYIIRDSFIGSRELHTFNLGLAGGMLGTRLYASARNIAVQLCGSKDRSLLVSGSAPEAQFGEDGVGFIDTSNNTELNSTLPDPGFAPSTCVIVSPR